MKRRSVVLVLVAGALAAASATLAGPPPVAHAQSFGYQNLNKIQKRLISSELLAVLGPSSGSSSSVHASSVAGGGNDDNGQGADGAPNTTPSGFASASSASASGLNYFPSSASGCSATRGANNIKVNQNCLNISDSNLQGRGQANNETSIAEDPLHPGDIVASDNDYIRGDGTCGAAYSTNSGQSWANSTVPDSFTLGTSFGGNARQYWQGGGDTSVAWDTQGNAYLACQLFNRGSATSQNPDQSSAFVVFRSTGNDGASWDFPGRQVAFGYNPTGTTPGAPFEDKELLAVDNHVGSPFQDRVYVTWTEFASDGTAYIYESYSKDYGQTFSAPVLVSKVSPTSTLCANNYGLPTPNGNCNENQFSQPFVGADGALYVTYNNFNNATANANDNHNQILLAKSTNGGGSFTNSVKVSDYYDLPDCVTYQGDDPGRACVPEKGSSPLSVFRATNYSSGQGNPTNANQVVITVGSYINQDSKESNGCSPAGFQPTFGTNLYNGVKTAGACNNKILVSVSNNGGHTFSGATVDPRYQQLVNQTEKQENTDQYWQWTAFTKSGKFAVDYYDRSYGNDEFNGSSDYTLSTSWGLAEFDSRRVTTSSMPAPTQFYSANGGVFYGDYTGLTGVNDLHPIWSDTRNLDLFICPGSATPGHPPTLCSGIEPNGQTANDQEIYTATLEPGPNSDSPTP